MKRILSGVLSVTLSFGVLGGVPCVGARPVSSSQATESVSENASKVCESSQNKGKEIVDLLTEKEREKAIDRRLMIGGCVIYPEVKVPSKSEKSWVKTMVLTWIGAGRWYARGWRAQFKNVPLVGQILDTIALVKGEYKDGEGKLVLR